MDFREVIKRIERLLKNEEYTPAARECVTAVEQALRQVLKQNLYKLEEKDRLKVQEAERKKGGGKRGFESFTMGVFINVILESGFFDALSRATGNDLKRIRCINFDGIRQIWNDFAHGKREAARDEAEFLFKDLKVILEDFGIISPEDAEETSARNESNHGGDEQRRRARIAALQKQWDLLNEKLSRLEHEKIRETRADEKFRLENTIAEIKTELRQVEEQLGELENQPSKEHGISEKFVKNEEKLIFQ